MECGFPTGHAEQKPPVVQRREDAYLFHLILKPC